MRTAITPEPALLGFLRQSPLHGYDLYKQVTNQLGPVWHLGQSQMYAILKDYEQRGWIQSVMEPQSGRPTRKTLQLTPEGAKVFEAWMKQASRGMREFRVDFFTRLYFAQTRGSTSVKRLLDRQIEEMQRELESLSAAAQTEQESNFAQLVQQFRVEQLQAILQWLEQLREDASAGVTAPLDTPKVRSNTRSSPKRRK
jgi:DNA-binding PadR family transcriptional regulator